MRFVNEEKIKNIKIENNNYYVAIDFDKTITKGDSCDSWDATGRMLGDEFKKDLNRLSEKYGPIELDYKISFKEKEKAMQIWYSECMNLYYKYNLTEQQLDESVRISEIVFRDGAKDILKYWHSNNIPVIVLSAGIGNIILKFLKLNNCLYDNMYVISNFLSFDENGKIKKYENDIIHTLNKTMKGHITEEISSKIANKEFRLLFGDFIEDKNIISKDEWDRTISTGFLSKNIEENTEIYKKSFDIVLTNEDATYQVAREIIGIN